MSSKPTPEDAGAGGAPGPPDRRPARPARILPVVAALVLLALGLGAWLGWLAWRGGDTGGPPAVSAELLVARDRAAHFFEQQAWSKAREVLAPIVAPADAAAEDLLRAAAVEVQAVDYERARALLARAEARAGDEPALHFLRARMLHNEGRFEEAIATYGRALEGAPDDLPALLGLAIAHFDLQHDERAEELLRRVLESGIEHGGSWYLTALHRMQTLLFSQGRDEEAERFAQVLQRYRDQGFESLTPRQLDRGNLGAVPPAEPQGTLVEPPLAAPTFELAATILPELAGAAELFVVDVDGDRAPDLVAAGPRGLFVARSLFRPEAPLGVEFEVTQVSAEPVLLALPFDLGNDDDVDLLAVHGRRLVVYETQRGADPAWFVSAAELAELPSPPAAILASDMDHDGDLDLLCAGDFGLVVLRSDGINGADERWSGRFTDVTEEAGLAGLGPLEWIVAEDHDGDQDVDYLLGGAGRLVLASNLRGGRFEDLAPELFPPHARIERRPLAADLDADARVDLLEPGEPAVLWRQGPGGRFQPEELALSIPPGAGELQAADLDLDGSLDAYWSAEDALAKGVAALGLEVATPVAIAGPPAPGAPLVLADLDKRTPLAAEIVRSTEAGIEVFAVTSPVGGAVYLEWFGRKDNRRGVGAVVELRAGPIYRRIYWRGRHELAGVGPREWIDVVRVTWPNGTVQSLDGVELGIGPVLDPGALGDYAQPEGLIGSCPFLYTWNGSTYEFISDVLGITPLGLPIAPGRLVPPDHDEYVLVRGEQLVPREGFLELQVTEELREVTYLDRLFLEVVDHPAGSEVFPNERFCFPPFPEVHTHTVERAHAPLRATGSDGADWTEELAWVDGRHAAPFEPLEPQLLGLATPHFLELEFDPRAVAGAERLRLLCTGWFYWTDASVNVAASALEDVAFVPPILQVPDGDGGWTDAGPPVGFPAGKTKTMVIELEGILRREDPRLRIFSTLRLYWDAIRLATCGDDAELATTRLEPAAAQLWRRGFSVPAEPSGAEGPERFDWERLAVRPRWNQHPGRYTRYGDVLPLLEEIDDRFVILGAGDALGVRFDAALLPPLREGFVRDYLVFFDGWAKDRDPNTVEALEVEPLPFHGMSGYPYGPGESFPDTEAHRAWRAEWNTRAAHTWIEPLAPRGELEYLSAGAGE